jgi:hypothetical protein
MTPQRAGIRRAMHRLPCGCPAEIESATGRYNRQPVTSLPAPFCYLISPN